MSRTLCRAVAVLAAAVLLAGCGAGGFGGKEPTRLDTSISNYVALGDGYAAAPYVGRTADKSCLRSADNYPAQVAKALGVNTFADVTCTGAGTQALTGTFRSPQTKKKLPPQIDAITADTDLITVGIGIADRNLMSKIFNVCVQLPCASGTIAAKEILDQLDVFDDKLTSALREMQNKAPSAYIVVVGYPTLVTDETCAKLPTTGPTQLDVASRVLRSVNNTLQSAARQTGSAYVNVASLTATHGVCSERPWVTGKDGKKGRSIAYHPLAAEQEAVAKAVADQVRTR
jgi:hypothetical protein